MLRKKIRVLVSIVLCMSVFLTGADYSSAAISNKGRLVGLQQKKKILK